MRGRRLREDGGCVKGGVQGSRGRKAGRIPRAHHPPRPAALQHRPAEDGRASREHGAAFEVARGEGSGEDTPWARRGEDRHGDRDACAARREGEVQGPRARHRGRGAQVRRRAEGEAEEAKGRGGRDSDERDPHTEDAPAFAREDKGHKPHKYPARGTAGDRDVHI